MVLLPFLLQSTRRFKKRYVHIRCNRTKSAIQLWNRDKHGNGKERDSIGPIGFPWEWEYNQPWDGNGIKVCRKWELKHGSGKKSVHTVTSKHL